jgi:Concanavalin A-like lectin/glucanases superfamily
MLDDKKGLSAIIITVIMIGLVLAAIAIVWVVISGLLSDELGGITAGRSKVILSIDKVTVEDNGNVKVKVSRNAEEGDLTKVQLTFENDAETATYKEDMDIPSIGGAKTITVTRTSLDIGSFNKISVSPILELEDGDEKLYDETDSYVIDDNKVFLRTTGLSVEPLAWWKFEGDIKNEFDYNDYTVIFKKEELSGFEEGVDGNALYTELYVRTGGDDPENANSQIKLGGFNVDALPGLSVSYWLKQKHIGNPLLIGGGVFNESGARDDNNYGCTTYVGSRNGSYFSYGRNVWNYNRPITSTADAVNSDHESDWLDSDVEITSGEWYHIAVRDAGRGKPAFYVNGERFFHAEGGYFTLPDSISEIIFLNWATASIDEVMLFDRTITEDDVQKLYKMYS